MCMLSRDAFFDVCSSDSKSVFSFHAMNDETIILRRRRRRRRRHFAHLIIMIISIVIANDVLFYDSRQSFHLDSQHDVKYIQKLMSYDRRIFNLLRLNRNVFKKLIIWTRENISLRSSRKNMTIKKQLNIFLFIVEQRAEYRLIVEMWTHSLNIISQMFHKILTTLFKLYKIFVVLFTNDTRHSIHWRRNKKFWFWFKDCVDALNDTHVHAHVFSTEQKFYRNRKNQFNQNVLIVCDFNMRYIYILTEWKSSANDVAILRNARFKNFDASSNKYYLANVEYINSRITLTSYREIKYHLKKWIKVNNKSQNKKSSSIYVIRSFAMLSNEISKCLNDDSKSFVRFSSLQCQYKFDWSTFWQLWIISYTRTTKAWINISKRSLTKREKHIT